MHLHPLKPETENKPMETPKTNTNTTEIYWADFYLEFGNPTGGHEAWKTDHNNLSTHLQSQSQQLADHPECYRAVVRNLIHCAHELDTIILGGGLLEHAMNGNGRPLAGDFVPRCEAIQREILVQSSSLVDCPLRWAFVSKVIELLGVLVGRLVLFGDVGEEDDDGDGVVEEEEEEEEFRAAWARLNGVDEGGDYDNGRVVADGSS